MLIIKLNSQGLIFLCKNIETKKICPKIEKVLSLLDYWCCH